MDSPFVIQPMRIGTLLDHSFRIYRWNFLSISVFSLLVYGIVQLLSDLGLSALGLESFATAFLQSMMGPSFYNNPELWGTAIPMPASNLLLWSLLTQLFILLFVTPFITGGITNISGAFFHGIKIKPGEGFSFARRHFFRFFLTGLVQILCTIASFFALLIPLFIFVFVLGMIAVTMALSNTAGFIVTFVILYVLLLGLVLAGLLWTSMIFPVALHERTFGFVAAGRAFVLYFKGFFRRFWTLALAYLLSIVVGLTWSLLSSQVTGLIALPFWATTLITTAVNAITLPILPIAATLCYLDARMRREGYDLYLKNLALRSAPGRTGL